MTAIITRGFTDASNCGLSFAETCVSSQKYQKGRTFRSAEDWTQPLKPEIKAQLAPCQRKAPARISARGGCMLCNDDLGTVNLIIKHSEKAVGHNVCAVSEVGWTGGQR